MLHLPNKIKIANLILKNAPAEAVENIKATFVNSLKTQSLKNCLKSNFKHKRELNIKNRGP